jgi:Protein of unknown function (DUF1592)/Protein of unknown function (DUF1588)/Protein of unknown function (DUF1585)/Protein of unknown function (DUF1595)/Protein of unknown function (DUF1587)/Planctomycete cytochrome C
MKLIGRCAVVSLLAVGSVSAADDAASLPLTTFRQYCFQCHSNAAAMGGIRLEQLASQPPGGDNFKQWQRVATVLEESRMPPKGMPQPADAQRAQVAVWVRGALNAYVKQHDGEPGRVTVRRLTSGEYGYAVRDLTGLDLDTGIDAATDSVGGEGFTNFGDVQFMQDANLEHYLAAAKKIAAHAVIGSGPIEFFADPGKTGFELSAITRIKDIYAAQGFRTVSGEGGFSYGLEKYDKVFYVTWLYQNRAALGDANSTLEAIAAREGVSARFARHVWTVVHTPTLLYPSSEMAEHWRKLPVPGADAKASIAAGKAACQELQKFVTTWPLWLFARGDAAFGGAGDESPLIITDKSLTVPATHHFTFFRGGRAGRGPTTPGPAKIFFNVASVNPGAAGKPVVLWRNATVAYRQAGAGGGAAGRGPAGPKQTLRAVVSPETAAKLHFGVSPDGSAIGSDDFASELSVAIEVPVPAGPAGFELQFDAEVGSARDQVFRIVVTDREDGTSRGIPVRALIGDPKSAGARKFKAGVLQLAELLPPNSQGEPTPADKDPIPEPFDSTYNVPEHDDFDTRVKYIRQDTFIYRNILDDASRARVDHAWNDLYASFEYHDNYLDIVAKHYGLDLKGKHIGDLSPADFAALPADARKYALPLKTEYDSVLKAQAAARPGHVEDCLKFAARAWRRPLTAQERQSLRGFYDQAMTSEKDHPAAIRAVLARILISPDFLYRVESPVDVSAVKPLSNFEMASRLSFFLWSSIPDDELRRAAAAGELSSAPGLQAQVKRMLADSKARRLSAEFFGQWLGFYHFDQFKGVDTSRFPEFTDEVKSSMYDEAVSFFEHIIRKDRPVREILSADYTFLNQPLAKFYGVKKDVRSKDAVELVDGANGFQRGGLLRLGAVLTATSAPLRTSPVKRGDWVLRRILGTPVPPPPADAGSIPADDKLFGGLSVKERLQQHKRNATCANCHMRIDPLGFALEHYDSTGRWREKYADGKAIEDSAAASDGKEIAGIPGLLDYLQAKDEQVRRTLAFKMVGYALGRTVQASDEALIDRMVQAGGNATFSQLAAEIVTSKQFRNRLGREDEGVSSTGRSGGR